MITRVYDGGNIQFARLIKQRASGRRCAVGEIYIVTQHGEPTAFRVYDKTTKYPSTALSIDSEYKDCFELLDTYEHYSIDIKNYGALIKELQDIT